MDEGYIPRIVRRLAEMGIELPPEAIEVIEDVISDACADAASAQAYTDATA